MTGGGGDSDEARRKIKFQKPVVKVIESIELFSKLTQMLPKKAKMKFWLLGVGGTLIHTRSFCSPGLFLVAKTFTRPLYNSKKKQLLTL